MGVDAKTHNNVGLHFLAVVVNVGDIVSTAAAAAEHREPKYRKVRFTCSGCGSRFTRQCRVGIYSKCPKCGQRAWGPRVIEDLARQHATKVTQDDPPVTRKRSRSRIVPLSPAPHQAGAATPPATPDAPVPSAPSGAQPQGSTARRFLARIIGTPAEDDEL